MNASEFMYWYRRGHGPLFGADVDPTKKPSPFAVVASTAGKGLRQVGQAVTSVAPRVSWTPEQKADIKAGLHQLGAPFRQVGQVVKTVVPHVSFPSKKKDAQQISFQTTPSDVVVEQMGRYLDAVDDSLDALSVQESFGGKDKRLERLEDKLLKLEDAAEGLEGKKAERLRRKIERVKKKILRLGGEVEDEDDDLSKKEEEAFGAYVDQVHAELDRFGIIGIDDAILIGASAAVPAVAMALKSKKGRIQALEKKIDRLEQKLEGASGKKADRIEKKLEKARARIEKIQAKLDRKESMGAYTFVPAEFDDHSDPGLLGVRRGGVFGRSLDDVVADEMFGSIPGVPDDDEGPFQLWPADAATADEGTILLQSSTSEGPLSRDAEDGTWEGVQEFLSTRRRTR